ncbi:MAG TPA: Rieske 2Fe-2S domain-containing protein [Candidatus Limnocylindrales bacterium]|nr:Rieske 2Fe-2S domain-containing protein [Candidatus Limnocylindrales bacterium]
MADDGTTRGQFLSLSTVGIGAVIGGVIGVPVTAYMLAPVTEEAKFEPVFLGKVDQFPADPSFKPTPATYIEDTQNRATSPGLAFVQNTGKSNTDWLAPDAMFVVFSNRCMHLGCPIAVAQGVGFACPCHGGQYDKEGRRTAGPPIRPLDRFQWEIRNSDELWITQRWSVEFIDGHLQYFPVKMPGQPVAPPGPSLVADVLYPNVTYDHGPVPQPK